jgi:hypothetical protein
MSSIQEHPSAKRKELFKIVQVEKAIKKAKLVIDKTKQIVEHAKQLIINMPVQWSSTYAMLHRVDQLKDVCP